MVASRSRMKDHEGGRGENLAAVNEGGARRDWRVSLLLVVVCLLIYNSNLRLMDAGDTYPARCLPFAILRHGTVRLDPVLDLVTQGRIRAFWVLRRQGHVVSTYPIVVPIVVSPLYLPAVAYLEARGWQAPSLDRAARIMEKLTASLIAAVTVGLLYLLLRRRVEPRAALLVTVAVAFGTTTWVIGSQALWQHGLAELLMVGALLLLTGACTAGRALGVGALCVLLTANRPPDVFLAAALGLYALRWAGRRWPLVAAGALGPLALLVAYNVGVMGNLGGGYFAVSYRSLFGRNPWTGFAGLLVSPARGLLVFSPFFLFLALRPRRALGAAGERGERQLTLCLLAGMAALFALYAHADWRAGASWGPRWLTDVVPALAWMLAPVVADLGRAGRAAFAATVAVAIAIEGVGAFWYTGASEAAIYAHRPGEIEMSGAWQLANTPFLVELRHARPPGDLAVDVRGTIDRMSGDDVGLAGVTRGTPLVAEGWALADGRAPGLVAVSVDDRRLGTITAFTDRADVRAMLRSSSPCGWSIAIPTEGLRPGPHLLQASARADSGEGGRFVPLAQRRFEVLPPPP
jgi:hypothetical protein